MQRQVGGRIGRAGVCWGREAHLGGVPAARRADAGTGRRARAQGWGARRS